MHKVMLEVSRGYTGFVSSVNANKEVVTVWIPERGLWGHK